MAAAAGDTMTVMSGPRPLARPPIVEAIVDIRAVGEAPFDEKARSALRAELAKHYPTIDEPRQLQFTFQTGVGPSVTDLGNVGIVAKSSDQKRLVHFKKDGWSLHQLAPYQGAERLFEEALRLWALHLQTMRPKLVNRVALRYINSFNVPLETGVDVAKFLTVALPVPPKPGGTVSECLTRVVLHPEGSTAVAIVTQRLQGKGTGRGADVALDVDVFRAGEFETDETVLLPILNELRALKNDIFFSLVTNDVVDQFS